MAKTCKSGHILRKGYTRKSYTRKTGAHVKRAHVSAACIPDVGASGKGLRGSKGIGTLKKGELAQFGYSASKTARSRHTALNAAIKKYGPLSVYRKLNAVAVYAKRTSPSTSKVFLRDRAFVGKKVGYKP
jgi:Family of unknown function (DUF5771)